MEEVGVVPSQHLLLLLEEGLGHDISLVPSDDLSSVVGDQGHTEEVSECSFDLHTIVL